MTMRVRRVGMLMVLCAALALGMAACGKKGNLKPPAGEKSSFPRSYPSQ